MMSEQERIAHKLVAMGRDMAVATLRSYGRLLSDADSVMASMGWERVGADIGDGLTSDGRHIVRVGRRAYALRPDVHAERLASAFEAARQRRADQATKEPEVKEEIAAMTCPQLHGGKPCGGALNRKGVCPSCVTGKMGYRYRYTCESCGCDIVTREELR